MGDTDFGNPASSRTMLHLDGTPTSDFDQKKIVPTIVMDDPNKEQEIAFRSASDSQLGKACQEERPKTQIPDPGHANSPVLGSPSSAAQIPLHPNSIHFTPFPTCSTDDVVPGFGTFFIEELACQSCKKMTKIEGKFVGFRPLLEDDRTRLTCTQCSSNGMIHLTPPSKRPWPHVAFIALVNISLAFEGTPRPENGIFYHLQDQLNKLVYANYDSLCYGHARNCWKTYLAIALSQCHDCFEHAEGQQGKGRWRLKPGAKMPSDFLPDIASDSTSSSEDNGNWKRSCQLKRNKTEPFDISRRNHKRRRNLSTHGGEELKLNSNFPPKIHSAPSRCRRPSFSSSSSKDDISTDDTRSIGSCSSTRSLASENDDMDISPRVPIITLSQQSEIQHATSYSLSQHHLSMFPSAGVTSAMSTASKQITSRSSSHTVGTPSNPMIVAPIALLPTSSLNIEFTQLQAEFALLEKSDLVVRNLVQAELNSMLRNQFSVTNNPLAQKTLDSRLVHELRLKYEAIAALTELNLTVSGEHRPAETPNHPFFSPPPAPPPSFIPFNKNTFDLSSSFPAMEYHSPVDRNSPSTASFSIAPVPLLAPPATSHRGTLRIPLSEKPIPPAISPPAVTGVFLLNQLRNSPTWLNPPSHLASPGTSGSGFAPGIHSSHHCSAANHLKVPAVNPRIRQRKRGPTSVIHNAIPSKRHCTPVYEPTMLYAGESRSK